MTEREVEATKAYTRTYADEGLLGPDLDTFHTARLRCSKLKTRLLYLLGKLC